MWPRRISHWLRKGETPALRFLALGDSYTIGEGVAEKDRWPMQLAERLRNHDVQLDVRIIAKTGWTTDELSSALDDTALLDNYDLVSLLIGVNNQYRGRDLANYVKEYETLLKRAIGFARNNPKRVFAVSIPDWGDTPFGENSNWDVMAIGREIDAFNNAAKKICSMRRVVWCEITDLTRSFPQEVADDGLHPNARMYTRWATRMLALPTIRYLKQRSLKDQ
jgi:lysophospholipase L1-like esterase